MSLQAPPARPSLCPHRPGTESYRRGHRCPFRVGPEWAPVGGLLRRSAPGGALPSAPRPSLRGPRRALAQLFAESRDVGLEDVNWAALNDVSRGRVLLVMKQLAVLNVVQHVNRHFNSLGQPRYWPVVAAGLVDNGPPLRGRFTALRNPRRRNCLCPAAYA
jgi:hypothetical protein